MNCKLEFNNGMAKLIITPSDEWEQKMLGAVTKGDNKLSADVSYETDGHWSYGKVKIVSVMLFAESVKKDVQGDE